MHSGWYWVEALAGEGYEIHEIPAEYFDSYWVEFQAEEGQVMNLTMRAEAEVLNNDGQQAMMSVWRGVRSSQHFFIPHSSPLSNARIRYPVEGY